MNKPREFELLYSGLSFAWQVRPNPHGKSDDEYVKVLEKSAYDQLLADARELQKTLTKYASREFWSHGGFNRYGNQTAIAALETFTKKYGEADD